MNKPLLEVRNLQVYFPVKSGLFQRAKKFVKAVDDVSFDVNERETLGIVGESGCGKSTTGRAVLQLIPPTSGFVHFEGESLVGLKADELRRKRQNMQMVFQDPYSSLNPRLTVERILAEPLQAHGKGSQEERRAQILEVMELCGLSRTYINRYAHEFSGGQRQRICIARALILKPKLIVADEPVSALDVSIQSQILNLMQDLQRELGLTYLFISHDLAVVRHLCTRVGVMYLGRMAEIAPVESLYETPLHPYTQTLLSAIPKASPREAKERIILQGEVPSPLNPPSGCAFSTRCPHVMDRCRSVRPELQEVGSSGHRVACHLYDS
ncbi:ABC transporter ATP-binding protein [Paenibacillus roseipurpureus]|uniref:Dipeptide ABC transporter ATP-binding protein n=1 Tax=Paenibacillus roseopurpureus TaxID=2918901 RepID=A0AA96RLW8_9BACL|nr:dipeptide ABC transporter ATP-binding protein [Paenibacillus sp. MBLB1832]WNR46115.1 dipeptide ABC transporter ATP-binding protein [Paenibacillus sp. MBLB1832]